MAAPVCVNDDLNHSVCVKEVRSVVSLSPHVTELVAFVGGAQRLVGVDVSSDYPEFVQSLPRVGDSQRVDLERLLALEPDLVVVWGSGTSPTTIKTLRAQKVPVFVSEPLSITDVARNVSALGKLLGHADYQAQADLWLSQFDQLKIKYSQKALVRVLYQVWDSPLMAIGGRHVISNVMGLCGGVNVFASENTLAPTVSVEAVLARQPELILTSGDPQRALASLAHWSKWTELPAVAKGNVAVLPADVLVRNGPRLIEGARAMCDSIERARP